jgi:hypothetical protein
MAVDGRIVLGVLATPFIYSSLKSSYWSVQLKKLNDREVLSERYAKEKYTQSHPTFSRFSWLYKCMLDDEIEKAILSKNEKIEPIVLGNSNVSA